MLVFKELKKGFPVFILNKETLIYQQGKVTQDATPPRMNTVFGQPMIVDVSLESEGQVKIWTLPADQSLAEVQSDANIVIATDKAALVNILKSIESECTTYLEGIDGRKQKLEAAKNLIAELDVVYKQQQQTEERALHPQKTFQAMPVTEPEIVRSVMEVQLLNASSSMYVTPSGMTTLVKEEHS